jgi:predicted transposase/invertase (TIGR01784 family)
MEKDVIRPMNVFGTDVGDVDDDVALLSDISSNVDTPALLNVSDADDMYRPYLNSIFVHWMGDQFVCTEFLSALLRRRVNITDISAEEVVLEAGRNMRGVRLDVMASDAKVAIYNVEMQTQFEYSDHFARRLYYASRLVSTSLKARENFRAIPDTYVVFLNVDNHVAQQFVDSASLRYDQPPHGSYGDKLHFYDVNLSKFDEDGPADHVLSLIQYFALYGHTDFFSKIAKSKFGESQSELLAVLFEHMRLVRGDKTLAGRVKSEFEHFQNVESREGESVGLIEIARREGELKGELEGKRTKGLEVARSMLAHGEDVDKIIAYTGLSMEDITKLQGELEG